jgi:hypothetical protein
VLRSSNDVRHVYVKLNNWRPSQVLGIDWNIGTRGNECPRHTVNPTRRRTDKIGFLVLKNLDATFFICSKCTASYNLFEMKNQ